MSEDDWWEYDDEPYRRSGTITISNDQVEMFTIDIENCDSSDGYWYTEKYIDDMCIPPAPDYKYTTNVTYGGLDYTHAGHEPFNKTKAFRKDVASLLVDIKRVSPAGSGSFELAKDFMDKHYGEESN